MLRVQVRADVPSRPSWVSGPAPDGADSGCNPEWPDGACEEVEKSRCKKAGTEKMLLVLPSLQGMRVSPPFPSLSGACTHDKAPISPLGTLGGSYQLIRLVT